MKRMRYVKRETQNHGATSVRNTLQGQVMCNKAGWYEIIGENAYGG